MDRFTKETDKRFTLRLNKQIYDFCKEQAEYELRPICRQIEYILYREMLKAKKSKTFDEVD